MATLQQLQDSLAKVTAALDPLKIQADRLTSQFASFQAEGGALITLIETETEAAVGETEDFCEETEAMVAGFTDELEERAEALVADLEEELERLKELAGELRDHVLEQTEQAWQAPVAAAAEAWAEELGGVFEEQMDRFTNAEETMRSALTSALESLESFAGEELADLLEEEARETLDAALERLRAEVLDGVIASQLQMQMTAFMAPILPQLMTVRVVAGTIKRLLDILRMGF